MPDVNILLGSYWPGHPTHVGAKGWLEDRLNGTMRFGMSEVVLAAFVRIATRGGGVHPAMPPAHVFEFCNRIRQSPQCVIIRPGSAHWPLFEDLCTRSAAAGDLVADASHAALAIENGCTWVTMDTDFAKFPGLIWQLFPDPQVRTNAP